METNLFILVLLITVIFTFFILQEFKKAFWVNYNQQRNCQNLQRLGYKTILTKPLSREIKYIPICSFQVYCKSDFRFINLFMVKSWIYEQVHNVYQKKNEIRFDAVSSFKAVHSLETRRESPLTASKGALFKLLHSRIWTPRYFLTHNPKLYEIWIICVVYTKKFLVLKTMFKAWIWTRLLPGDLLLQTFLAQKGAFINHVDS